MINPVKPTETTGKSLGGALAGFATTLLGHWANGAPIEDVITSGGTLLQAIIAAVVAYAIVYFSPKNQPKG